MTTALPLDCSLFAEDFLRNTIRELSIVVVPPPPPPSLLPPSPTAHLSSPLPGTRRDALALVRSLAGQCSDEAPSRACWPSSCRPSEVRGRGTLATCSDLPLSPAAAAPGGTVTVAEHRGSVLAGGLAQARPSPCQPRPPPPAAIEALSHCPLSAGSQEALAAMAVDGLAVYIKQEGSPGRTPACLVLTRLSCSPPRHRCVCRGLPEVLVWSAPRAGARESAQAR